MSKQCLVVFLLACGVVLAVGGPSSIFAKNAEKTKRIIPSAAAVAHGRGGLDLSQLGNVANSPPDFVETMFEDGGPSQRFQIVPGVNRKLWYGETDLGESLNLLPFVDRQGNTKYVGTARAGDLIYDIGVDHNGEQYVTKMLSSDFPEEDDPVTDDEPAERDETRKLLRGRLAKEYFPDGDRRILSTEMVTLRIIVPWTRNAECGRNNMPSGCTTLDQSTWDVMYAHVQLAVEMTNVAYALSDVYIELELVHAYRVNDYVETSTASSTYYSHALNSILGTTDGYMDSVHEERERYQAHMVSLMVEAPGSEYFLLVLYVSYYFDDYLIRPLTSAFAECGTAKVGPAKYNMFSVVRYGCATNNLSFAHEGTCSTVLFRFFSFQKKI